jgi:hypothetical protein
MTPQVSLKAIIDEMDVPSEEHHAYLNKRTGELFTIADEEIGIIESGDTMQDYPDWQREAIRKTQEVLASPDFLELPSKFDIHEYAIIERYSSSREDSKLRQSLLDCIHGSGAFRRFKEAIHEYAIADDWYQFRHAALREIATEWLDANNISYTADDK